jgi:hypothetical protein
MVPGCPRETSDLLLIVLLITFGVMSPRSVQRTGRSEIEIGKGRC